jgi:hypothetical protein
MTTAKKKAGPGGGRIWTLAGIKPSILDSTYIAELIAANPKKNPNAALVIMQYTVTATSR